MWNETVLCLGIVGWIVGFFRVGYLIKNGNLMQRTFVRPPFLVFVLCGMPKSKKIPDGVMAAPAVMLQLYGILLISYGLIYPYLPNHNLVLHGGLMFVGLILISIYIWILVTKNVYKVE